MKYRVKTIEELSEYPLENGSFTHAGNSFVVNMRKYCNIELEQHEVDAIMDTNSYGVDIERLESWNFAPWMITPIEEENKKLFLL